MTNEQARKAALEKYRLYQAYHNNPLLKKYFEKKNEIESRSEQKPSVKLKSMVMKYLIFSTIIYGLIFIVSSSEDFNEFGTVFFVLALLNVLFFIFAVIAEDLIEKVLSFIFPNENRYDEEKIRLLDELDKEYTKKACSLITAASPLFALLIILIIGD